MNCRDVNQFLDRVPAEPVPAELRDHAETCVACRRLIQLFESARHSDVSTPVATPLPSGLFDDLKPVRRLSSTGAQIISFVGAAAVVSALGVALWGLHGWQAQTPIERLLVLGSSLAALFAAVYGLTIQMIPGSAPRFSFFGLEIGALGLFAATVLVTFHREFPFPLAGPNLSCFERGLMISALAAVFLLPRMRRGIWLDRGLSAINAGAFLCAVALVVYAFFCPVLNFRHVFIGHFGALAVVMAVSWLVGILWGRKSS
jgi:hypothetical protein